MSSTAFPFDIPFLDEVGVEYLGMEGGKSQVALNLEPHHMNSWQVTHGGVVMTLLDVAMAMAGITIIPMKKDGLFLSSVSGQTLDMICRIAGWIPDIGKAGCPAGYWISKI